MLFRSHVSTTDKTTFFSDMTTLDNSRVGSINWYNYGEYGYFNGNIDNIGIWKRDLSAQEITDLYNSGNGVGYNDLTTSQKTDLVSWWSLNEITNDRHDSHGNNDLTDNGTVGFDTGKVQESDWNISQITKDLVDWRNVSGDGATGVKLIDGVWEFDGVNDYIDFGNVLDSVFAGSFTIEAWIKPILTGINASYICGKNLNNTISSNRVIFGCFGSAASGTLSNKFILGIEGVVTANENEWSNAVLVENVWQHVCVTYNLPTATVSYYHNGIFNKSRSEPDTYGTNNAEFVVGAWGSLNQGALLQPFSGDISNIKIYNRALTAQEITQNYEAQKGFFGL